MNLKAYCKSLVKGANTNFYYAFVLLPRPKRDAIHAAYAFSRHTDDIADDTPDTEAASTELEAWRRELAACYTGRPDHPVALNLQRVLQTFPIPQQHFLDLIDGVEMDLTQDRYATFEDLRAYCYRVASAIGLICIEIFGYTQPQTKEYAVNLGLALQLTNILRDVREDASRGRIYLPQEDLERFGCEESDLFMGNETAAFRDMMAFQCARARDHYQKARALLPEEDRGGMFSAQIMGAIYRRLLDQIERSDYRVFDTQYRVGTARKLGIAAAIWARSRFSPRKVESG